MRAIAASILCLALGCGSAEPSAPPVVSAEDSGTADVAEETAALSRHRILMQSGISVLAQANQIPQLALQLLQG